MVAELGVVKRTVQRDMDALEAGGFPLISEQRNGTVFWRFMDGFCAEQMVALTVDELMALYFSRGLLRPMQGTAVHEAIDTALSKIGAARRGTLAELWTERRGASRPRSQAWGR